ncbi:MAG: L-seryl-tRNA(Sec) selenium transferase [Alphaproteobacteria bacterium]|nr:L-seryl-tRNA(Sec) selenium transferase [Alphaproteobacteria bacterium]
MMRGPLPSVDEILRSPQAQVAAAQHGRTATVAAIRTALAALRADFPDPPPDRATLTEAAARHALAALAESETPRLRPVFNLTGTVLHTNLGRAVLSEEAIEAATRVMRQPAALEFDLKTGGRGERDDAVRGLVRELTGAEDCILVNNAAAAVFLMLNTVGAGREAIVSRGELIEIGGAFRMPDIMARAGVVLREVGTTNRTHARDYESAITERTALLMKVHTSNYLIQGFTAEVAPAELSRIGRAHGVPVLDDLGSGTLVDLSHYGLRRERTVRDALGDGADLVAFSGDKLLGGPQAGFIVGRADLVRACAKNPIKRAMRLDKIRLAALEATLRLYRDPDRLAQRLPTLRLLTRKPDELRALAERLQPAVAARLGQGWQVAVAECASQIGSGALPLESLPSAGLSLTPADGDGRAPERLLAALRALPTPVIGRITQGAVLLDLRCLEDEAGFVAQLGGLKDG